MGMMSEADLQKVHEELQLMEMEREVVAGVRFDDIFCTDADKNSTRRKPSPAMLLEAAEKWNIDLTNSWMIGDSMSDIESGTRAGTKTAYLVTEHTEEIPKATKNYSSVGRNTSISLTNLEDVILRGTFRRDSLGRSDEANLMRLRRNSGSCFSRVRTSFGRSGSPVAMDALNR